MQKAFKWLQIPKEIKKESMKPKKILHLDTLSKRFLREDPPQHQPEPSAEKFLFCDFPL